MVNFASLYTIVYSTMKESIKESYETLAVEVLEVRMEGIVCLSGGLSNYKREDEEDW